MSMPRANSPTLAPSAFQFVASGREDWSALLPSWQIICLCLALTLLVCWLRAHPGTLAYIKCLRGGQEGRWIAVHRSVEEVDSDSDSEVGDAARTREISMKYRELRNEGLGTSEAMELAESIIAVKPKKRKNSFKKKNGGNGAEEEEEEEEEDLDDEIDELLKTKTHVREEKKNPKDPHHLIKQQVHQTNHINKNDKLTSGNIKNEKEHSKAFPKILKIEAAEEEEEEEEWNVESYPNTTVNDLKKLAKEEKKLQRFRMLEKEGYEVIQARFLAGLPREENLEEFLWSEVQDNVRNEHYYWDGDDNVTYTRPEQEHIWRVFVVFTPNGVTAATPATNKIAAKEFEFGKGHWVDLGIVGLPPRPPVKLGNSTQPPLEKPISINNQLKKSLSVTFGKKPSSSSSTVSSIRERVSLFSSRSDSLPRPETASAEDRTKPSQKKSKNTRITNKNEAVFSPMKSKIDEKKKKNRQNNNKIENRTSVSSPRS